MTEKQAKLQPLWQKAIGIVIGTAVGGVIYGIFLQALLVQSLIIDRKPLDPAEWKEKLSGRAWICGLLSFLTMVLVPFKFMRREGGATVLNNGEEAGVAWFLIALILIVQIATVRYATMRSELCSVEHPAEVFECFFVRGARRGVLSAAEPAIQTVANPLQAMGASSTAVTILPVTVAAGPPRDHRPLLTLSFSLTLWKNWVQIVIVLIEFLQLFSMALDGGYALNAAGVQLFPAGLLESFTVFKNVIWQFGMDAGNADTFAGGFGALTGFGGLYILLCGIFIALDLTVDSWLAPFHFTLLAGGFYGSITSGLLFLILYSGAASHLVVSLLMLAYYSSTAVFVSIYRSDLKKSAPGEIRVIPVFTAVERVSKGVLAACSVAVSASNLQAKPALILGFGIYLIVLTAMVKPYSVYGMTALRLVSLLFCTWTALIVLAASLVTTADKGGVLMGFLITGWIGSPLLVYGAHKINWRPLAEKVMLSR